MHIIILMIVISFFASLHSMEQKEKSLCKKSEEALQTLLGWNIFASSCSAPSQHPPQWNIPNMTISSDGYWLVGWENKKNSSTATISVTHRIDKKSTASCLKLSGILIDKVTITPQHTVIIFPLRGKIMLRNLKLEYIGEVDPTYNLNIQLQHSSKERWLAFTEGTKTHILNKKDAKKNAPLPSYKIILKKDNVVHFHATPYTFFTLVNEDNQLKCFKGSESHPIYTIPINSNNFCSHNDRLYLYEEGIRVFDITNDRNDIKEGEKQPIWEKEPFRIQSLSFQKIRVDSSGQFIASLQHYSVAKEPDKYVITIYTIHKENYAFFKTYSQPITDFRFAGNKDEILLIELAHARSKNETECEAWKWENNQKIKTFLLPSASLTRFSHNKNYLALATSNLDNQLSTLTQIKVINLQQDGNDPVSFTLKDVIPVQLEFSNDNKELVIISKSTDKNNLHYRYLSSCLLFPQDVKTNLSKELSAPSSCQTINTLLVKAVESKTALSINDKVVKEGLEVMPDFIKRRFFTPSQLSKPPPSLWSSFTGT